MRLSRIFSIASVRPFHVCESGDTRRSRGHGRKVASHLPRGRKRTVSIGGANLHGHSAEDGQRNRILGLLVWEHEGEACSLKKKRRQKEKQEVRRSIPQQENVQERTPLLLRRR